jgi:multidrug efflux system membrane fusion protein
VAELNDHPPQRGQEHAPEHAAARSGRLLAIGVVTAAVLLLVISLFRLDRRPRSQDAFVYAYSTGIVPEVSGQLTSVNVRENQRVHKGDLLVQIERQPYELKLAEAREKVASLQAQVELTEHQVASQTSAAKAAATDIKSARSQLGLAQSTAERLTPLVGKGYTTQQQFDQAQSQRQVARTQLTGAIEKARQATQAVTNPENQRAQLRGAEAAAGLAEWDLNHTEVRAPFDGWVSGLDITLGTYAAAGHALFTLIKANEWYAVGNFRETELPSIQIGDAATIWLLGGGNRAVRGRVESIGWGVEPPNAGPPGLPKVGRTLSWVVIAQRFPVRIRLEDVPEGAARLGETANVVVSGHGRR